MCYDLRSKLQAIHVFKTCVCQDAQAINMDVRRKSNAGSIGPALQLLRKESCRRVALFMKYIHVFHLREERLGHPLDVQILS